MSSARRVPPALAALLAAALVTTLAAGCTSRTDEPQGSPSAAPAASPSASAAEPTGQRDVPGAVAEGYSSPVEDRVYPAEGDPGVDVLHYDLHLSWDPPTRTLDATETVELRATTDADELRLDLGRSLQVATLTLDGSAVDFDHDGDDLVVDAAVAADDEHRLRLHYSGTPRPAPAPTTRSDLRSLGWTVTGDGGVWTMQEPYGAFTWYAVNDQPSDKALYDFTISAPSPMVGVANGRLLSRREAAGRTVTRWRMAQPASSYLATVAIGDLTMTRDRSPSGVPITYWTPPDRPDLLRRVRYTPRALDWVEQRLGPYPFDTLGILVVDSRSGMETQTMITLGDTRYATSRAVLVHEIAHHWYGDEVTPVDWRDVWMNEGMAMYLQGVWTAESRHRPVERLMDEWATYDGFLREQAGPPADYRPTSFGSSNIYYIPAVMWDQLRRRIGDREFWRLVARWPGVHRYGNADYDDITTWWSDRTGEDLADFFDGWLLGSRTPQTQ